MPKNPCPHRKLTLLAQLGSSLVLLTSLLLRSQAQAAPANPSSTRPAPTPSGNFTPKPLTEADIKANQSFASGQRFFTAGKFKEAAEQLETTVKNNNKFLPAHYMLGICRYQLGEYALAEKLFVETTLLDSRFHMGYVQAAGAALAQGHYDDARRHANAIEKFDKKSFLLTYALGVIAYTEGKAHEAATLFERSRLAYDEYPSTLYNLSVALYNDHAAPRALPRIRQACLVDTKKPLYHFMQGWMLFTTRDSGGGYTAFRRLFEFDRGAYASAARGMMALQGQKLDEALREALEALRLDPELVKAWVLKGLVLARQGKVKEAQTALLEALDLDPCDVDAREALARMGLTPPPIKPARLPHPPGPKPATSPAPKDPSSSAPSSGPATGSKKTAPTPLQPAAPLASPPAAPGSSPRSGPSASPRPPQAPPLMLPPPGIPVPGPR